MVSLAGVAPSLARRNALVARGGGSGVARLVFCSGADESWRVITAHDSPPTVHYTAPAGYLRSISKRERRFLGLLVGWEDHLRGVTLEGMIGAGEFDPDTDDAADVRLSDDQEMDLEYLRDHQTSLAEGAGPRGRSGSISATT